VTRRRLRILQTSDVHLGPRSREPNGLLHHDECICPIEVLGHLAHEHRVDVVLIVGDLFEHARVSHQLVTDTFERLSRIEAEIALLPGNHDVYDETNVYRRQRDEVDRAGVRFFDDPQGQSFDFAGGALRVWARAMDDHSPRFAPLGDPPARPDDGWYIAAAHGHFVASVADDAHRSSRITPADIDATRADYVALGHWHVTTDLATRGVATPAWYSGAPMFGHGAGRMLLVDLVPGCAPVVQQLDVLDHPLSRCASVSAA
jgi:DNA repair exonuclease SbcCD nuclease subunit